MKRKIIGVTVGTPLNPKKTEELLDKKDFVRYNEQTLTEEQKAQARENIGAQQADESFELIESITVNEDGLKTIARTAEPDGKPYDLSAVTIILKVYGTDVMLGTQVDYYSGNAKIGSLLENIAVTYYTASNKFSSCVYHVRPKAGVYEFVSAYGAHAAMMDVHYPSNADYQTVDASKKITQIEFKLWTATNIPVGTQIEIYGVRS